MISGMGLLQRRRQRLRRGTCVTCGSFPCMEGMDQQGYTLRDRQLVPIRTTEQEQRQYHASLLPDQGCQSWEPQNKHEAAIKVKKE